MRRFDPDATVIAENCAPGDMMQRILLSEAPEAARSETVIVRIPISSQIFMQFTGSVEFNPSSWRTAIAIRSASALNPRLRCWCASGDPTQTAPCTDLSRSPRWDRNPTLLTYAPRSARESLAQESQCGDFNRHDQYTTIVRSKPSQPILTILKREGHNANCFNHIR